jgi:hypothetical protein
VIVTINSAIWLSFWGLGGHNSANVVVERHRGRCMDTRVGRGCVDGRPNGQACRYSRANSRSTAFQ